MDLIDDNIDNNDINEIIYFYKIVSKDGKFKYVGKTNNFHIRLSNHIQSTFYKNSKLYNSLLYKTIRNNGYWWNFEMVLIDTKYNIKNIDVRKTEQYYINFYECNLNTNKAYISNEDKIKNSKEYVIKNKAKINERNKIKFGSLARTINLIKNILNYNDRSEEYTKLYFKLLNFLNIDLVNDYNKNIIKRYMVGKNTNKFYVGFINDILTNEFMEFINNDLILHYNNKKLKENSYYRETKVIKNIKLDKIKDYRIIKAIIASYLRRMNLHFNYPNKNGEKILKSFQFTLERIDKNIYINYPVKKVKSINYLQNNKIIIFKDINNNYVETINGNIILKPNNIIEERIIKEKKNKYIVKVIKYYDDNNNELIKEEYKSYDLNNNYKYKNKYFIKYFNNDRREMVLNFINFNLKNKLSIKDRMEKVFKELLTKKEDLTIINLN